MNFSEKYIAHIRDEDNERQPLIDHLTQTAILAALFAGKFDNSEFGYYAGLLHDIGKYSDEFQRKIKNRLNIKCDHSAAGARELEKLGEWGKMLSYCVAGHHAGLPDSGSRFSSAGEGTLYGRLNKEYIVNNYDAYLQEIKNEISLCEPNIKPMGKKGFSISFFVRMLYSCLVDADFLDTEKFMQNGRIARAEDFDFNEILSKLNKKLSEFSGSSGIINEKRAEILNSCRQKGSEEQPGLFTLTVPTGGGKTLSSMAFALNHLMRNGMKRIIYVIPYTSIIEQTAKIFKDVFGEDCVLEHHSNYSFPEDENDDKKNIMKLSSENWSMPIIVTTNVQFFESLFANKPSKCRKLHNIANSVIIFDEVQMLPVIYLKPCVRAIAELVHNYKCTAVLCTATQPSINSLFPKDIKMPKEICENPAELYELFKRTDVKLIGKMDSEKFKDILSKNEKCLIIVNTRRHALKLFDLMNGNGKFHLSALMCPVHRQIKIKEIKDRLKNGLPCRVVSTRLIEAGVDVDFPVVYRAVAGLDSIVQAAGRCNREGKLKDSDGSPAKGQVFVFEPEEEEFMLAQNPLFSRESSAMKAVLRNCADITSLDAISCYFNELYSTQQNLDEKNIVKRLEEGIYDTAKNFKDKLNFDFSKIANDFSLIDQEKYSVIIPFDENANRQIEKLRRAEHFGDILRSLQGYTVNIYKNGYDFLKKENKLEFIKDNAVLKDIGDYDSQKGLRLEIKLA